MKLSIPRTLCALILLANARTVSAQAVAVGAEFALSGEPDANRATGYTISVGLRRIELRMSKSKAESNRVDVTCSVLDVGCADEQVKTTGRLQSWFMGYEISLHKSGPSRVVLVPEAGFARLDGTRSGQASHRTVTKRGDYEGIGLRAEAIMSMPGWSRAFVKAEAGMRGFINFTIGEALDAYEPYLNGQGMGIFAMSVGYSF